MGVPRASFTFTPNADDDVFGSRFSRLAFATHFRLHSTTRFLALASAFIVGFTFTAVMKWEHIVWLAASTAGASPLLAFGQGGTFDYPGLRFGADKKFSIAVFSDLHLGERECTQSCLFQFILTTKSLVDWRRERTGCRFEDHWRHELRPRQRTRKSGSPQW